MIIGEEEEGEEDHQQQNQQDALPNMGIRRLNKDLLSKSVPNDVMVPLEELTLFVDPLDGTREFVEGRLSNVACLIGIARQDRPIAGVIGLPFPDGTWESDVSVLYALSDLPAWNGTWSPAKQTTTVESSPAVEDEPTSSSSPASSTFSSSLGRVTILTGDSNNPVLVNATRCALSLAKQQQQQHDQESTLPIHSIIGGTAAKLRMVATEPDMLAITHFQTELWDTCAPEALITARGGTITDLFGTRLVHAPNRPFGNIFGVVASSGGSRMRQLHEELCATMRADSESVRTLFANYLGQPTITETQAMDAANKYWTDNK